VLTGIHTPFIRPTIQRDAVYGLQDAISLAYEGVKSIRFNDMFHKKHIASRYEPKVPLAG
jgi:hypothetical protein